jgi:transcription elongation GreA/GreB family factor
VSEILNRLTDAVARRDFGVVEDLWLELLEAPAIPAEELARLVGELVEAGQGPRALDLVLALAPELVGAERYAEALPLFRAVTPAAQGNEEVRNGLLTCYRRVHRGLPHLAACIDRSGLLANEDLAAAAAKLDRLLSYREGDCFYHAAGWGVGCIVGFDPLTTDATIDFDRKPGHRVPIETIEDIFVRLQPDSFHVLRKTDPDRLRRLAQEDPAALVRSVIVAHDGRMSTKGLRGLLAGEFVPAEAYSKWWSAARGALKRDPLVAMTAGSNPLLTLRARALTYEEEMNAKLASFKDLAHLAGLLREYAEHRAEAADPEAFLMPAARAIAGRIATEPDRGAAFEASLLLTELGLLAGEFPRPEEIVGQQADPIPLLNGLRMTSNRNRAMELLRRTGHDWEALCYRILLSGPKALWDAAAGELREAGDPPSIAGLVHGVLDDPGRSLELFAWACRNLLLGRWRTDVPPLQVFEHLLTQGDTLARRKASQRGEWTPFDQNAELALIRQSIRAGDLQYFDQMLQELSETEATRLFFRIRRSGAIPDHLGHILEQKIIRRYPKLLAEEQRAEAAPPEYLYATAEAIERHRKEHDHIANVLLPKNSEDIRRAAAMGDLTDNADWRAAIQEQQVLNAKVIEIAGELLRARPIEPSMVSTELVSIGSRVTVENAQTGERHTYAILGPWDSDDEHGIIAYLAPLAQALLRHRVGDEATLAHAGQEATYRVVAIGSAMEKGTKANG